MTATLEHTWSVSGMEHVWTDPTDPKVRYRAFLDHFASPPEGDCYVPQFTVPTRDTCMVGVNHEGCDTDGILEAWERFHGGVGYGGRWSEDDAREAFKRWARVFCGVNAEVFDTIGYSQGDYATIITWPDAEWCRVVGVAEDYTPNHDDVSDLEAYIFGDTWILALETLETYTHESGRVLEQWEAQDHIGGIYTRDIKALEVLDYI